MKLKMTGALTAGLLLTCCSGGLESKARNALAGQLEDVESAQFRNLTQSKPAGKNGDCMICGEVKSKKGDGFTRFMVETSGKGGAVFATDPVSSAVLGALINTACKKGAGSTRLVASLSSPGQAQSLSNADIDDAGLEWCTSFAPAVSRSSL